MAARRSLVMLAPALILLAGCGRSTAPPPAAAWPEQPAATPGPVVPVARRAPDAAVAERTPQPPPPEHESWLCGPSGRGPRLAIRGVGRHDILNVRAEPGAGAPMVGQLPPDARGIRGTGERRKVEGSVWRKVTCGALVGWVNQRYLVADPRP